MWWKFLFSFLVMSLFPTTGWAQACRFPQIRVESQGDQRVFTRCRGADDCETFASFTKKDVESYSKIIDQKDNLIDTAFAIATLPIGGVTLTSTRIGRVVLQYSQQHLGVAYRGLRSLGKTKTPPPAGLWKELIEKEFGARAGNIFAALNYPSWIVGGALAFSGPNLAAGASNAASLVLKPLREEKDQLVTGQGEASGTDQCADAQIAKILDIRKRIESFDELERRRAACSAITGPRAAACNEDLERYRRAERLAPSQERIRNLIGGQSSEPSRPPPPVPAEPPRPVHPSELVGDIVR